MKRKRRRRKRKYTYFSMDQLKHRFKKFLIKHSRACFYIFTSIILAFLFFLFYIAPDMITKSQSEAVFMSTDPVAVADEKVLSYANQETEETELITINGMNSDKLINTKNIEYKSDEYYNIANHFDMQSINISNLNDLNFLKNNLYIVDPKTDITKDVFDVPKLVNTDLHLEDTDGPKVLIFNTHSSEVYKDSNGTIEGVVGLSYELQKVLEEKYGIKSIVHEGVYDMVDGKSQILGAYQRMTPDVEKILAENPSIEVCIDIHRDGLPDDIHLVTDVNGKPTAQIMFVNGLSKVYNSNGVLEDAPDLPNPNRQDNLAFSLALKLTANEMYPGFSRKIYLHAYRYSLFMKPKSLLVEVGSQTNTWEECKNAMEPLADILAANLLPSKN